MDVQFCFDTKTGRQRTNTHFAFNKGIFWQGKFVACRHELHRAQEAGRVARGKQLLRVGHVSPHAAHLFWHTQFDVQYAIGGGGTTVTATGGFCFGGINNFF